jgi:hypothetical protein
LLGASKWYPLPRKWLFTYYHSWANNYKR